MLCLMFIQVGGEFATAAVLNMNLFGRISCCGAISGYNLKEPEKRELNKQCYPDVASHTQALDLHCAYRDGSGYLIIV